MDKKFILVGQGLMLSKIIEFLSEANQNIVSVFSDDNLRLKKYKNKYKIFSIKKINNIKCHDIKNKNSNNNYWLLGVENTLLINNNIISLYSNKCINFHPGILPEYAGMFVYQWAILNKEKYFGSSIHFINDKIDQGKIIKIKTFKILKNDTGLSMYLKCLKVGFSSFKLVLNNIIKNKKLSVKKQNLKNRNVFYIKDLPNSLIDFKKKGDYIIDFVRSGNFLPLKSPSFQPQIIQNIYIYKVKLLKKVNFKDSNLYFENFKPIVRTGDDYGIKIILAKYKSGKELEYNDWKKLSKKINNLYE